MRTLTTSILICATTALAVSTPTNVDARPRPTRNHSKFEANKTFGLGLMFGVPSGLSGKYFLSPKRALDFGIGGVRYYRGRDGLHLHVDHLWHPAVLAKTDAFELPFYVGVGARFFNFTDRNNDREDRGGAIGVRLPAGLAMDFNTVPLDVFFEVAFVMDLLINYEDNYYTDLTGAVGVRYYFR